MGKSRPATVANHKTPHRGDRKLFFYGELESACKNCHDQAIQRAEGEGFAREIDGEGWPIDPKHPFNVTTSAKPEIRFQKAPPARARGFSRPGVK